MTPENRPARIWEFAGCEFDEAYRELRVNKKRVDLESKPLQVLHQLLLHDNEVVSHDEFFAAVWPGQIKSDSLLRSLFAAISRLRKVLPEAEPPVILTVHGFGYRLTPPITIRLVESGPRNTLNLKAGDEIPGRPNWIIEEQLIGSHASEVWLARRAKTQEARVFKFALTVPQLDGLKREVTLSRWFRKALPSTNTFVEVLDWNFEQEPFFLESAYGGPSLDVWAKKQGGLKQVPLEIRLEILNEVASAVASAHGLGVLHKDLKPGNILINQLINQEAVDSGQPPHVRIADFGSAALSDPERLRDFDITNLGFDSPSGPNPRGGGTWTYTAPEVREGGVATAGADVYALGVLLYQLVIGDFTRQLTVGWESEVPDPLLREDIALAASGDPAKRLVSAADVAARLSHLEQRREKARDADAALHRAALLERKVMQSRARRPWLAVAILLLIAGVCTSLWFNRRAVQKGNLADARNADLVAMNRFLSDDLLAQGNPLGGKSQAHLSLLAAIQYAAGEIDQRFAKQPMIAGRLHFAVAQALGSNDDMKGSENEYEKAAGDFKRAEGAESHQAAIASLREAFLDANSTVLGSAERASSILRAQKQVVATHAIHDLEIDTLVLAVDAELAVQTNKLAEAFKDSQAALALADSNPALRLDMLRLTGFVAMRMGNGAGLETCSRALIQQISATQGSDSPALLNPEMQLMESFLIQRKFADAVDLATKIYPEFVRKVGQYNQTAFQILGTKAAAETSLGRLDDAIRDDLLVQKLAYEWNPHSAFAIGTFSDVAASEMKKGDWKACEHYAGQGWELIQKEPHPVRGLQDGVGEMVAVCLLEGGAQRDTAKLNEAEQLLRRMDVAAVTSISGDAGIPGDVALMFGEIAFARQQYLASEKYADQAAEHYKALSPPDQDRLRELRKLKNDLNTKLSAAVRENKTGHEDVPIYPG